VAATEGAPPDERDIERLHAALVPFLDPAATLDASSAQAFRAASAVLLDHRKAPFLRMALSQRALRDATHREVGASALRLEHAVADSRTGAIATVAAIALLPVAGLLAFVLLQRRVTGGLSHLHGLLERLAEARFVPVEVQGAEPILRGLLDNYNKAVRRLDELEREHARRARTLEQEVRQVTQRLMEQQGALARGERLAAVGELAASVAHELRNPLAGIQVAVANIRDSCSDPELRDRAVAIYGETQRMGRLLQDLLAPVRQQREVPAAHALASLLEDFASLTVYQAPERVVLRVAAPAALRARIPAEGMRQALLNLVLNAFQAMQGMSGAVTVTANRERDRLVVRVIDEGPGFPAALLREGPQVLRSGRESGTGLGLAIVQRFVGDFGGELVLSNRSERGAEACLSLPFQDAGGVDPT
jgi:signal transduction histidine kinase